MRRKNLPLHTTCTVDDSGRKRTVLYGYLSLGGEARSAGIQSAAQQVASAEEQVVSGEVQAISGAALRELPPPFGHPNGANITDPVLVVQGGKPSQAFIALLDLLVLRYRIGLEDESDNQELEAILSDWYFDEVPLLNDGEVPADEREYSSLSVLSWLQDVLVNRSTDDLPQNRRLMRYLAEDPTPGMYRSQRLPHGASGTLRFNLHCDGEIREALRTQLQTRFGSLVSSYAQALPVARMGGGGDDIYQAIPFVRYGCAESEKIAWGPATRRFRVAPALCAEAAPPQVLELPSLRDLTRGRPTVGFRAPGDLAKKLLGLKQKR